MKFDPYEYIGVIVPGSVVLVALNALFPEVLPAMTTSLSVGDFGLLLILAFIAGHIIQSGGNLWEKIVWSFTRGMPTSWASQDTTSLLSNEQLERLEKNLRSDFGSSREALRNGRGLVREILVVIRNSGHQDRIEKFNRSYGLMRGVAVAFIATAVLILIKDPTLWRSAILLLVLAGIATLRMIRFGIHYARELYAEYLAISSNQKAEKSLHPPAT